MTHTTTNSQSRKFIIIAVIAIIAIGGIALLRRQTTAQIAIAPIGHQATVFTNKSKRSAVKPQATTTYSVRSGQIEVIVSSQGRYPWRETVTTSAGSTTLIQPFLVPEQPRIVRDAPNGVRKQLASERIDPTQSATSSNKNIRLIANDNDALIAEWVGPREQMPSYFKCQADSGRCGVEVYAQSNKEVEQVGFYPGRSDVAIFATKSAVYAVEINPTGQTQNFQPINTTLSNPHFLITNGTIFVGNENRIIASQL